MHPFLTLCSLVLFAAVAQTFVPLPIYSTFSPCRQKWDCKNNCTREKTFLDSCCSDPRKICAYDCQSFDITYRQCLKRCTPKPKSCPTELSLDKGFCNKACSHGLVHQLEKDQCLYTMSSVSVLCRPLCQDDGDCIGDEKCCPSACAKSCQKPV